MFHYMDAKIRRGGCLLSPDGYAIDLRSPEQIRADKAAEIDAVASARAHYVYALAGLYAITAQKGVAGSPVRTFSKVQYYIGRSDPKVSTGYLPGDNLIGYNFGVTTRLVPAQVRSDQYPTIRPAEKVVRKEIQGPDVKTYTHFTFPDGQYGFADSGDPRYAVSEQWSSSDGYTSGRVQGGSGVFIGGIRYDLSGAFPSDDTTYTVECAQTVLRHWIKPYSGRVDTSANDTIQKVPIYDDWSIKDMLDVVTLWQTPRTQPDPNPETDYTRAYNAIDKYLLEYRSERPVDWNGVGMYTQYGYNGTGYGEQFMDGDAIYYYSELGIGLALHDSEVTLPDPNPALWPPWEWTMRPWGDRQILYWGLPPCRKVNLLSSGHHYHKAYIRTVSGEKVSGSFKKAGYLGYGGRYGYYEMPENIYAYRGVFVVNGQAYACGARYFCAVPTDPFANHIFRTTSAPITPDEYVEEGPYVNHAIADTHGIRIADKCVRATWSGPTLFARDVQHIPFVTMCANGKLVPVVGFSRALFSAPTQQVTFIPGGEDFTQCASQEYPDAVSINAHGAALYTRTDSRYVVDVIAFTDYLGKVQFPVYRTPEKLLSISGASLFVMDYNLAACAYKWAGLGDAPSIPRYYVNLYNGAYDKWANRYESTGAFAPAITLVTPQITGRTLSCDLPQGWIAYLSKRQRAGDPANQYQHVGEGACGNRLTSTALYPFAPGDAQQHYDSPGRIYTLAANGRPDGAGSLPPSRLPSPGAVELPRPVDGVVTIPRQYVGDWFLQIVDTYYCVMRETAITL
jgi:hypothetical protein